MYFKTVYNTWYLKGYWLVVLYEKGNVIEDIDDILVWTIRWFWYWTEIEEQDFCVDFVLRLERDYRISYGQDFMFLVRH